jgi:RHS repeat-associated protein
VGSSITNYLWDEASTYGDVVSEYNSSGSTLASYVLGGNSLISQNRSGTTSYFLGDGQGSTRALTNSTGGVTDTYSYTAFGELFNSSGTTVNLYRYTGQQFDSLTGLYDLRARYYNPALGRFLSQDTYPYNIGNPVELNRYVYAANDPINLTDPTGNAALAEYVVLGATFGGAVGAASTYACGGNLGENIAIGVLFGAGFGVGFAYLPLATNAVGLALSGAGAISAFHDKQVNGWNTCNRFNFAMSLLGVAFSAGGLAKGGIDYINDSLRGLSDFGIPDEFMSPIQSGQWRNWSTAEQAKWLIRTNTINPSYSQYNCAYCTLAGDQTLGGNPMVAPASGTLTEKQTITLYSPYYGGTEMESMFWHDITPSDIIANLQQAGDGARGIVAVYPANPNVPGHMFNVINDGGRILAFDFQKRIIMPFEIYSQLFEDFHFFFTGW